MQFSKQIFGYNIKQVNLHLERMENAKNILEQNVKYLSERCELLEKQIAKNSKQDTDNKAWQISKDVVSPIKKSISAFEENERID